MFSISLFGVVCVALALVIGYAARKYVEKKYPAEGALVDSIATKYGESAAAKVKAAIVSAKATATDLGR